MKAYLRFIGALAAFSMGAFAQGQTLLLQDLFDTEASFTASPNADQSGSLAPALYDVGASGGFPNGVQRRGAGVLELGFNGTTSSNASRVFTNANFVTVANTLNSPIRITFDINAAPADWVGFVVGTNAAWVDSNGAVTEFSAIFNHAGDGNRWVNGAGAAFTAADTSSLITLELRNTAGTGSPFNGTGSIAQLWRGTTSLGIFTLDQLSDSNARFAFTTWNGNGGDGATIDNFTITATSTLSLVARWNGAINSSWDENTANFSGQSFAAIKNAGITDLLFGDTDGALAPVTNTSPLIAVGGVEIANVIFDNVTLDYTLAASDGFGITGNSNLIKSGAGQLTLSAENSYVGTTTITAGSLILSAGDNRLPVSTSLTVSNSGSLRLNGFHQTVASLSGNGRIINGSDTLATLTIANSSNTTFAGNIGGTSAQENNLALVKSGNGTLALTAASSFTGGTTIDGGVVSVNFEQGGTGNTALGPISSSNQVTINDGGILTSNGLANNWLSNTNINSGAGNAISVTINEGGILRSGLNRITGLGLVALNGGTIEVANGLNGFGWFAAYNLGGDITVGGSTPSQIITVPGSGAAANLQLSSGNNSSGGGSRFFIVDDVTGDENADLRISARIANGTIIKSGPGTVEITNGATGTGFPATWEIDEGLLRSASNAHFEFRITNNRSNSVIGTGLAEFLGPITIDTSLVTLTSESEWPLIDMLSLAVTYGPDFSVADFADPENDGTWVKTDAIGVWTFTESTGNLTLAMSAVDDFTAWSESFALVGGAASDDDQDGLTNFMEYAFALAPNSGSSVNPIASPLDRESVSFSYTRRDPTLTGLAYTIWYSTDLIQWTPDAAATETSVTADGDRQTVVITLSNQVASPLPAKLFVQVRASVP